MKFNVKKFKKYLKKPEVIQSAQDKIKALEESYKTARYNAILIKLVQALIKKDQKHGGTKITFYSLID